MICALTKQLNYPDTDLTYDIVHGVPIVGDIARANTLQSKDTLASTNFPEIRSNLEKTNLEIPAALAKSNDTILRQKCWDFPWAELEMGWLSEPNPVTASGKTFTILPPRFCISEQHGLQEPKYRLIGDVAKSN